MLGLALLLSGAAALIFEIVWVHRTGLVFGNSVWATSLVLASFMAGLAFGNYIASRIGDRIQRPILVYGLIELAIGATGVLLTVLLPRLPALLAPVFGGLQGVPWLVNPVRLILSFALLVIPTTAMGLTLPLVVAALCRRGIGFGPTLGVFYGLNTLGAVGGVILAETVLVLRFGVRGAAYTAAGCNLVAFVLAALNSRWLRSEVEAAPVRRQGPSVRVRAARLLLAAFLLGWALLALEVLWFRFLLMFVVNSSQAIALMLAVVLAGIGIGGFAGAGIVRLRLNTMQSLFVLTLTAAATTVLTYRLFEGQLEAVARYAAMFELWYARHYAWTTVLAYSLHLMLPGSLVSGALFALVGQALKSELDENARTAGLLTLANTVGAMLGALAGAFVLLPSLGLERSFWMIAVVYVLAAMLVGRRGLWAPLRWRGVALGAVALIVVGLLATFPFGLMRDVFIPLVAKKYEGDGSKIIATREGPTETILYMRNDWLGEPLEYRLVTNGFSMSSTNYAAKRYMRLYAFWPAIVAAKPIQNALVISYGVGVTASAVRDLPTVEHADVVDTSRDIVEMSDLVYQQEQHPLRDPRVQIHIEDGRHFLQTARRRYDLITGEPPPPRCPGIGNLYSREYFQLIHDRLTDGGVTTYWLPIHDLLKEDVTAIIRAFGDVFENGSVWNGTPSDWMLVGFRGDPQPATLEGFVAWWEHPVIGPQLAEMGLEVPEQLGATFLGDARYWREITAETPPLTDDWPKRLRPLYGAPSPERMQFFSAVVNPYRTRSEFAQSPFIHRLWPQELRLRTDNFFELQHLVNIALSESDPIGRIDQLHRLLTTTQLSTLPLWCMGATPRHVEIAAASAISGEREYLLAIAALAGRRYRDTARFFESAREHGVTDWRARYLQVYALCMAGDTEAAKRLAGPLRARATDADQVRFWQWLRATLGV
jgi:predicted membrane-bound spermidine synthase